jgi:4a-hydroxytetrahydrobiopterin dehydratase
MAMAKRDLTADHCVPCSTGDKLGIMQRRELLKDVPSWSLDGDRIVRELAFKDFSTALKFANAVGRIAEREDHHPDLHLTEYKLLRIELTTHAAEGLSRNDFILAAKIDELLASPAWKKGRASAKRRRPVRRRELEGPASYPVPPF